MFRKVYLFAIKQKVKLSGAPVLLMLLRPTWPPLDHYSLGGLRERYNATKKILFYQNGYVGFEVF